MQYLLRGFFISLRLSEKIVAGQLRRSCLLTQLRTPPDRPRGLDCHEMLRGDQVVGGGH